MCMCKNKAEIKVTKLSGGLEDVSPVIYNLKSYLDEEWNILKKLQLPLFMSI